MNDDSPRDFADRMLCEALSKPENLRGLLRNAVPELADGFDFERMRPAKREFSWAIGDGGSQMSWSKSRIARTKEKSGRWSACWSSTKLRVIGKCHSRRSCTRPSTWEWQWRVWEGSPTPKAEFKLTPMLPIVLHTGLRPWGSAKSLRELLGPPAEFHAFTPDWQPMFWELAKHSPDELVDGPESFLQALAIFKADDAELEEAQELFRRIFRKLDPLHETGRVHWRDLLGLILSWAQNRRSNVERKAWTELADNLESSAEIRREIQAMGTTIAQELIREARQEGFAEGAAATRRSTLLRLARKRFGQTSDKFLAEVNSVTDIDRLDRMTDLVNEIGSLEELLAVE